MWNWLNFNSAYLEIFSRIFHWRFISLNFDNQIRKYLINWITPFWASPLNWIQRILSSYRVHSLFIGDVVLDWTFTGALLFSVTTITTIGYGNVAPKTLTGRITCIFYSIFGLPITMLCVANIGIWFAQQVSNIKTRVAFLGKIVHMHITSIVYGAYHIIQIYGVFSLAVFCKQIVLLSYPIFDLLDKANFLNLHACRFHLVPFTKRFNQCKFCVCMLYFIYVFVCYCFYTQSFIISIFIFTVILRETYYQWAPMK